MTDLELSVPLSLSRCINQLARQARCEVADMAAELLEDGVVDYRRLLGSREPLQGVRCAFAGALIESKGRLAGTAPLRITMNPRLVALMTDLQNPAAAPPALKGPALAELAPAALAWACRKWLTPLP